MTPETFKSIRAKLEITQKELAEQLGVSLSQLKRYESGKSAISGPVERLMVNWTPAFYDSLKGGENGN